MQFNRQLLTAQRTIRCPRDLGPFVALGILEHLERTRSTYVDCAHSDSSESFSGDGRCRNIVNVHVNVKTVLPLLGLEYSLEG
jgi:hypothetical protein